MLRCAIVALALSATALPSLAQSAQRPFPPNALRGELVVGQPPQAELNGKPARLAPGSRIRGENNLMLMSGAVVGRTLIVNYTRDEFGLIKDVWVLTPDEMAKRPWPTTPEQAAAWQFDPFAQTWSKP